MAIQLIGRRNAGFANERWETSTNEAVRTASEIYIIKGDVCAAGDYDTETEIAQALTILGVPNLAEESLDNPGLYCVNRSIRLQPGSENIWEVTVDLDNNPLRGKNAGGTSGGSGSTSNPSVPTNPFFDFAQVSMSTEDVQIQSLYDRKDYAMASGSGEVLDGFLETIPVAVMSVSQLQQFVNVTSVMSYVGKIHNTTTPFIGGFGQYEILFSDFDARPTNVGNVTGYDCTYRFRCLSRGVTGTNFVNPGTTVAVANGINIGWRSVVPNYATFRKPTGGETVFDVTATREKRRPRWWLTTAGAWAADDLSDISYLLVNPYGEANLNDLQLRIP